MDKDVANMKRVSALLLALLMAFSLMACGDKTEDTTPTIKQDLKMTDVYDKMSATVELPEMLQLQESMMLDYCGVDAAKTKQAVVQICADSLRTDEIWLLEAVDEAAAKDLVDAANERLRKKGEESITYSPEQYAVVQKAQLIQAGNYVVLIVSPDADTLAATFRQEAGM